MPTSPQGHGSSRSVDASATARRCGVCKQDCSHRPRVKDKRGNYLCEHAFKHMKAAKARGEKPSAKSLMCDDARQQLSVRGAPVAHAQPIEADPSRVPDSDDDLIGLADDDGAMDLGSLAALEQSAQADIGEAHAGGACPKCGAFMSVSAVICTSCGFNAQTGKGARTLTGKVAGKKEKGGRRRTKDPNEMSERERTDWETSREVARKAYLMPLMIFLVCAGLSMAIYAAIDPPNAGLLVASYAINIAISAPFAIAAFYLCAVIFLGFDAPFPLVVVRMLAVISGTGLAEAGKVALNQQMEGLGMILWLVPWFVYIVLMVSLMEMEFIDAIIVGVVSGFIKFMAVAFIAVMVIRMIGGGALAGMTGGGLGGGGLGAAGQPAPTFAPTPQYSPCRFVESWGGMDKYTYLTKDEFRAWKSETKCSGDLYAYYRADSGVFIDYDGDEIDDRTGQTADAIAAASGVGLLDLVLVGDGVYQSDWYQQALEDAGWNDEPDWDDEDALDDEP